MPPLIWCMEMLSYWTQEVHVSILQVWVKSLPVGRYTAHMLPLSLIPTCWEHPSHALAFQESAPSILPKPLYASGRKQNYCFPLSAVRGLCWIQSPSDSETMGSHSIWYMLNSYLNCLPKALILPWRILALLCTSEAAWSSSCKRKLGRGKAKLTFTHAASMSSILVSCVSVFSFMLPR